MINVQQWFINVLTKTKLFPPQYTNEKKSRLHVDLIVFVYKMCLYIVLKLPLIPHYNGYSTEPFIGFSMYVIT